MTNTKKRQILEYNAVFQQEKDGGYSVWVPALPGCTSQGETFDEAVKSIREAIGLYLEDCPSPSKHLADQGVKQFFVPITYQYA